MYKRGFLALGIAVAFGGVVTPSFAEGLIAACVASNGKLRVISEGDSCKPNETVLTWNIQGPQGPQGREGPQGLPGTAGTSCSVEQVESSAVITCEDGTSAAIASAGTVVTYPEGLLGQVPPTTYPTGAVVVVDAEGTILAEVLDIWEGAYSVLLASETGPDRRANIGNGPDGTVVFGAKEAYPFYYLQEDCLGTPFIHSRNEVYWDDQAGNFLVIEENPSDRVLFASTRQSAYVATTGLEVSMGECANGQFVASALPAIPYYPALEILNAVYPVHAEQLP